MPNSRWLVQTLILSVALNVALLCTFFYFLIHDNPLHFSYRPKVETFDEPPPLTQTMCRTLHTFPFEHLVDLLQDQRKVRHGYCVRDFALSVLASCHDFDVERGLGRCVSKRKWEYDNQIFLLFSGLNDTDFDILSQFGKMEKWPITWLGLLQSIKSQGIENSDPAMINFFFHTPAFALLETLFARAQLPILKKNILALVLECEKKTLEEFYHQQISNADFSDQSRQRFLLNAINDGSKIAAYLLLVTDEKFALEQLMDKEMLKVLDLLTVRTQKAAQFVHLVAESPRSDAVRAQAAQRLLEYAGTSPKEMAGHFYEKPGLKNLKPTFRQKAPASHEPSIHVIQPGESLWLIAQKYHLTVEELIEVNRLQSTVIQVGKTLKIPPG